MRMRTGARLLRGAGISRRESSARAPRTSARPDTPRSAAICGVQIVSPSSISAWFQSPARFGARSLRRMSAELPPAARLAQIAANGAKAREDARDVAVEHGERHVVRDAQHRGRRVAADAGKGQRGFERARKFAVVMRDDFLRGAVQVARAAVVAEAGPQLQNLLLAARAASDATSGNCLRKRW